MKLYKAVLVHLQVGQFGFDTYILNDHPTDGLQWSWHWRYYDVAVNTEEGVLIVMEKYITEHPNYIISDYNGLLTVNYVHAEELRKLCGFKDDTPYYMTIDRIHELLAS
jgi:hypothetical protein